MKQKDLKTFMRMHEISERFNHNKSGANFNAAELCDLDQSTIKSLIDEGYKMSEIMMFGTKAFQTPQSKKRYEIIKKYIEDFDANNNLKQGEK